MRSLPLAPGYKITLTTLPYILGQGIPRQVEMAVTGVEAVQVLAGRFNCYRVSFASLGQTFWIGVDGTRPLVKFQSGNVEAELVKMWGPSVFYDALAFLKTAGWALRWSQQTTAGPDAEGTEESPFQKVTVFVSLTRIYTPPAQIAQELRQALDDMLKRNASATVEPGYPPDTHDRGAAGVELRRQLRE